MCHPMLLSSSYGVDVHLISVTVAPEMIMQPPDFVISFLLHGLFRILFGTDRLPTKIRL